MFRFSDMEETKHGDNQVIVYFENKANKKEQPFDGPIARLVAVSVGFREYKPEVRNYDNELLETTEKERYSTPIEALQGAYTMLRTAVATLPDEATFVRRQRAVEHFKRALQNLDHPHGQLAALNRAGWTQLRSRPEYWRFTHSRFPGLEVHWAPTKRFNIPTVHQKTICG